MTETTLKTTGQTTAQTTGELETRTLGKTDIRVTRLGLGLWAAGGSEWGPVDDQQSLETIERALERGVTFFDTADVYGQGHSEELLGRAMKGRREKFVVASKIGWTGFDSERRRSAYDTVDKLVAGVESNLRRLGTDYLDLIQSHIDFRDLTMEVFVEGFARLKKEGKVRAYGVSTSDFAYLKAFNHDGGCDSLQIDYSILNRTPEREIFPYCQEQNIAVIVRGPLAMGLLTDKFSEDSVFPEGDFRRRWHEVPEEREVFRDDLHKVAGLRSLTNGRTMVQLALQFVLAHPAVTTVIPGAKNVSQLEQNLSVASLPPLSEEAMRAIDAVTPPGGGRKIWPA